MHNMIDWLMTVPEIQDIFKESKERQEKLFKKAEKNDLDERLLDALMEMPKKWRDKIVMQKVAEGIYRGPFEEFYPTLRKYGAEPEALKMFWSELCDTPINDVGIIQKSFLWWPKGTPREVIWRWFDEKYPGGVVKLMGFEMQDVIEKLCEYRNPGFILTRKEMEQLLKEKQNEIS